LVSRTLVQPDGFEGRVHLTEGTGETGGLERGEGAGAHQRRGGEAGKPRPAWPREALSYPQSAGAARRHDDEIERKGVAPACKPAGRRRRQYARGKKAQRCRRGHRQQPDPARRLHNGDQRRQRQVRSYQGDGLVAYGEADADQRSGAPAEAMVVEAAHQQ
jgi:hypothetical protein